MTNSRLEIAPLPAKDTPIADAIKASCDECMARYGIKINQSACHEFLLKLDRKDYEHHAHADPMNLKFPLQFSSPLDELNVLATVCLLEGFHGYEDLLQSRTGRGVWEVLIHHAILGASGVFESGGAIDVDPNHARNG